MVSEPNILSSNMTPSNDHPIQVSKGSVKYLIKLLNLLISINLSF